MSNSYRTIQNGNGSSFSIVYGDGLAAVVGELGQETIGIGIYNVTAQIFAETTLFSPGFAYDVVI